MKVSVTARHVKFSDRMKAYAYDKAQHLEHYFDHLRKLEVILDADGEGRVLAEIIASAVKGQILVCHSADVTAMAAVDSVVGKMERQLVKFKEKLHSKNTPHATGRPGKENRSRAASPGATSAGVWW